MLPFGYISYKYVKARSPSDAAPADRPKRQRRASAKATEALLNITLAADMQAWGYLHHTPRATNAKPAQVRCMPCNPLSEPYCVQRFSHKTSPTALIHVPFDVQGTLQAPPKCKHMDQESNKTTS